MDANGSIGNGRAAGVTTSMRSITTEGGEGETGTGADAGVGATGP